MRLLVDPLLYLSCPARSISTIMKLFWVSFTFCFSYFFCSIKTGNMRRCPPPSSSWRSSACRLQRPSLSLKVIICPAHCAFESFIIFSNVAQELRTYSTRTITRWIRIEAPNWHRPSKPKTDTSAKIWWPISAPATCNPPPPSSFSCCTYPRNTLKKKSINFNKKEGFLTV